MGMIDPDPAETREWREAIESVLECGGAERAQYLLRSRTRRANSAPMFR